MSLVMKLRIEIESISLKKDDIVVFDTAVEGDINQYIKFL